MYMDYCGALPPETCFPSSQSPEAEESNHDRTTLAIRPLAVDEIMALGFVKINHLIHPLVMCVDRGGVSDVLAGIASLRSNAFPLYIWCCSSCCSYL